MRSLVFLFLLVATLFPLTASLGELPESDDDFAPEPLDSGSDAESESESALILNSDDSRDDVDGPTPPSVASAPLDPLPAMSVPLARPPGFRPPTSFKVKTDSGDHVNVGFVVRRGRAKVMGFSRRKTEVLDD